MWRVIWFSILLASLSFPEISFSQDQEEGGRIVGVGNTSGIGGKVREAPDITSEVILELDSGQAVLIFDYFDGRYFKIQAEGVIGYLSRSGIVENSATIELQIQAVRENNIALANMMEKYGIRDGTRVYEEQVWIGMTEEMLIDSWGQPNDKNITSTAFGRSEQWIYNRGRFERDYVYLDDGVVTSIQN